MCSVVLAPRRAGTRREIIGHLIDSVNGPWPVPHWERKRTGKDLFVTTTPTLLGRPVGASGEETRRRIIGATVACVAEVGYSKATIREIARVARITSGSLYHYFPNKAELITATVAEMAAVGTPRLIGAAGRAEGVLDKLVAIFDECESIHHEYPHLAAFDRAIRAENARGLHVGDGREVTFAVLRDVIIGVLTDGHAAHTLAADVDVSSAANALCTIVRGLNEYATTSGPEEYHNTVRALKALVRGMLFDYRALD